MNSRGIVVLKSRYSNHNIGILIYLFFQKVLVALLEFFLLIVDREHDFYSCINANCELY